MRRVATLAMGLLLSACGDPRLKADSEANFDSSFAEVTKNLSSMDKHKLDTALKDIVLVQVGLYGPVFEAKIFQLPSSNELTKAFTGAMTSAIGHSVAANWDANRSKVVVQNVRAIVDGRTAKEVIVIADDERKKAVEAALVIYRDQLAKARSALDDLRAETKGVTRKQAEQKALLERIQITKPHFTYRESDFLEKPIISFTIANRGTIPIKRIFVRGKVQTPGRAIAWVEDDFNYEFPGGLEPGETKELNLAPNMFGSWSKVPKNVVGGTILNLDLVAFEDAARKRFGEASEDREQIANRKKSLEDGIRELEVKINDLELQLKEGG